MKTGDIYKNIRKEFPAPFEDYSRLCVIRSCTDEKVTFSVSADKQHMIDKGVYFFNRSAFTVSRKDFVSDFVPYKVFDSSIVLGGKI